MDGKERFFYVTRLQKRKSFYHVIRLRSTARRAFNTTYQHFTYVDRFNERLAALQEVFPDAALGRIDVRSYDIPPADIQQQIDNMLRGAIRTPEDYQKCRDLLRDPSGVPFHRKQHEQQPQRTARFQPGGPVTWAHHSSGAMWMPQQNGNPARTSPPGHSAAVIVNEIGVKLESDHPAAQVGSVGASRQRPQGPKPEPQEAGGPRLSKAEPQDAGGRLGPKPESQDAQGHRRGQVKRELGGGGSLHHIAGVCKVCRRKTLCIDLTFDDVL